MKHFFNYLYEHVEIILLVCLSVSFLLGMYTMLNRAGGPVTMDYIVQTVIGIIIIGDIIFLMNNKKEEKNES
ncbi:hypothetical protein [Bacillus sp. C1]